jgi:hypothetical protein
MTKKEQTHPLESRDRPIVNRLLQGEPNEENLTELARLLIRYRNFPGAETIQKNLQTVLSQWQLSEEELYEKTRQIYAAAKIDRAKNRVEEQQDWT